MASGGDWASALGAALQQFGSSYKDYSRNQYEKKQEAERIKQALARQEIEDQRYEQQQRRQGVLDERNVLKDFAENAPFESSVSPEMEQRFRAAGMEGLLGNRPETQTNIPSQFLMEGGAAQTADPGTFLRPSLQQQAAMQQLRANDPAIKRQLQLEEEARQQKTWEQRNQKEHEQQMALWRLRSQPDAPRDPFGTIFANTAPAALSAGMSLEDLAKTIRRAMSPDVANQTSTGSSELDQHLADLDSDIEQAGSVNNYVKLVKELGFPPDEEQILIRAAAQRANQRRHDISLP